MKRPKVFQEKLNNKGVSLVEIIIAMMILSVVLIPVIRVLMLTSAYNSKSRSEQTAVSTAESVMETFKGYDLEKLCRQFDAGSTLLFPSATASVNGYDSTGAEVSVVSGADFMRSFDEKYTFFLDGLTTDGHAYDAKIEVQGKDLPNLPASSPNALNMIPQNEYTDAIYMGSYNWDSLATPSVLQYVCDTINADPVSYRHDYVPDDFDPTEVTYGQRVIIITLEQNGDAVLAKLKIYYDCGFSYEYSPANAEGEELPWTVSLDEGEHYEFIPLNEAGDTEIVFYDNTATVGDNAKLENLYFYYYPCYWDAFDGADSSFRDVIQIHSNLDYDVGIHIFKQKNPLFSDIRLQYLETNYDFIVDYFEEDTTGAEKHPVIYHNFRENLSGSNATPSFPYFPDGNGIQASFEEEFVMEKPLLYTVNVEIYEHGDATMTPVAHFTGTMNE